MQEIVARSITSAEPPQADASGAIEFARAFSENNKIAGVDKVIGEKVISMEFSDDVLELQADNGWTMIIRTSGESIIFTVQDSGLEISRFGQNDLADVVMVSLGKTRFSWDRVSLVNEIVESRLKHVTSLPNRLLLYLSIDSTVAILAISVLVNAATARPFLYWRFSE